MKDTLKKAWLAVAALAIAAFAVSCAKAQDAPSEQVTEAVTVTAEADENSADAEDESVEVSLYWETGSYYL